MLGTRSRSSRRRSHGIFVEEAQRSVEGGAAPHFQAEEIGQALGDGGGGGENVVGADARGHQRLVRVAEGGVGDEQALFFARPGGEFFRAELLQELARAGRRFDAAAWLGSTAASNASGTFLPFTSGLPLRITSPRYESSLVARSPRLGKRKSSGRIVEERRGDFAGAKFRVIDDVFDEGNVGGDAADAELAQRAVHAAAGFGRDSCPTR